MMCPEDAVRRAEDAFFNELATCYPEAKTGDIDLMEQFLFSHAALAVALHWLTLNLPGFDERLHQGKRTVPWPKRRQAGVEGQVRLEEGQ